MKQNLFLVLCLFSSASALACADNPGASACPVSSGDISVGDRVYVISGARENTSANVVGIQTNGDFVLRFNDDGAVGANWERSSLAITHGCSYHYCVGESVITISGSRQNTTATIVAIDSSGDFVLQFDSDSVVGHYWSYTSLAKRKGSSGDLSVGSRVYAVSGERENTLATIIGIQNDGNYVLQFIDDEAIGHDWSRSSLAMTSGCSGNFCMGAKVYAVSGQRQGTTATIVGIEQDGNFVLLFDSDGVIGNNWSKDDIVCVQ